MIRLWLQSNGKDIVIYNYQIENGKINQIIYSKSRKATKIDHSFNAQNIYYKYLHDKLMQMGKNNYFPSKYIIAWY